MRLRSTHPSRSKHEEKKIMTIQEQERKERRRKLFRLLVIYPVAWIIVSVILFYLTRIG
jgi:cell division septal protein FtsQ